MSAGINRKIKKKFEEAVGSWRRGTARPLIATVKGAVNKFTKGDWNSIFVEGYGNYANDENKLLSGKGKKYLGTNTTTSAWFHTGLLGGLGVESDYWRAAVQATGQVGKSLEIGASTSGESTPAAVASFKLTLDQNFKKVTLAQKNYIDQVQLSETFKLKEVQNNGNKVTAMATQSDSATGAVSHFTLHVPNGTSVTSKVVTKEELKADIGTIWYVDHIVEETEASRRKKLKEENKMRIEVEKAEASEKATAHFKALQEAGRVKFNHTHEDWEEIRKLFTNLDPYFFDGQHFKGVIHHVPGGWRNVVLRREVHDSFSSPLSQVEEQLAEQNSIARRKVEASEQRNELLGKEKRAKLQPNTKHGLTMYGEETNKLENAINTNKAIDEKNAKKRENEQKTRMAKYYELVVQCEKRIKGTDTKPPTKDNYQATLKAAYQIEDKTTKDITNDIYGEAKNRTLKKVADVKKLWDAYVKRLGGDDKIQWDLLKAQYTIAEDESDSSIVDTEAVKSTVAQKRKRDDIDDSDDDASDEYMNEINDDVQSSKRLKNVFEDETKTLHQGNIMEVDSLDGDNIIITKFKNVMHLRDRS